jgi:hypothetical protein
MSIADAVASYVGCAGSAESVAYADQVVASLTSSRSTFIELVRVN